jgi:hypothetical protein
LPSPQKFYILEEEHDRTLSVEFGDMLFTPLSQILVVEVATLLRTEFPNWRVALLGGNSENTIMVYPDWIAVDEQHIGNSLDQTIKSVAKAACRLEYERIGATRRQLFYILSVFDRMAKASQLDCIAFDASDGGRVGLSAWILYPGNWLSLKVSEPTKRRAGWKFAINSVGIVQRVGFGEDEAILNLRQYLFDEECVSLVAHVDGQGSLRREISLANAVKDSSLPRERLPVLEEA